MFNPVSYAIYSSAGTSRDEALKVTADWYDEVKFVKVETGGYPDYFGHFVLEFPSLHKVNRTWDRVILLSGRVQAGSFLVTGLSFCACWYKSFQGAIPAAVSAMMLVWIACFAARTARVVKTEAISQQNGVNNQNGIEHKIKALRKDVAQNGFEKISNPSDIKFFSDGEVDQILHRWITKHDIYNLHELINPENKVMQGLIERLNENHPIKVALKRGGMEGESPGIGSWKFYQRYMDYRNNGNS